jgi:transmembrane protein 216
MAVATSELSNIRSSVIFEIFLTINRWSLLLWLLVESLSFVYKNATIIYPNQGLIAGEIILMLSVFFIDLLRILLGSISNRIESILLSTLTILLTIAIFFGYLYFIVWQLFVIRAELIMTIIALIFTGSGIIFLILCIIFFARPSPIPSLYRQMPYRTTM